MFALPWPRELTLVLPVSTFTVRGILETPRLVRAHVVVGGLTNPAPGVFDFEDWRALQTIFDAAKQTGIFVVLRPGASHSFYRFLVR